MRSPEAVFFSQSQLTSLVVVGGNTELPQYHIPEINIGPPAQAFEDQGVEIMQIDKLLLHNSLAIKICIPGPPLFLPFHHFTLISAKI